MKKLLIILLLFPLIGFAQKEAKLIRKGNKSFEEGDYKNAEVNYRKSLEVNNKSFKGNFNLGGALYNQKDFEGSKKIFDDLSKQFEDRNQKADAFHNLGNTFMSGKKYKESVEAFKNALRNNPKDEETRYNLEYAKQKLKEQEQQQQNQDQNKDQNKDQEDKKDQQDQQDQKDQEDKKDQQDQKDQQQNKDEQNQDQQQQQQQPQQRQISKQDAERMLEALKNNEKKTIEKLKKLKAKSAKVTTSEKDW